MDGFVFVFLPILFKLGIGIGFPFLAVWLAVPAVMRQRIQSLTKRRNLHDLEVYSEAANAVICKLIVEGAITTSSKEELFALQAQYNHQKSLTR